MNERRRCPPSAETAEGQGERGVLELSEPGPVEPLLRHLRGVLLLLPCTLSFLSVLRGWYAGGLHFFPPA